MTEHTIFGAQMWAALNSQGRVIFVESYRRDAIQRCRELTGQKDWAAIKKLYGISVSRCDVIVPSGGQP